MQILPHSAVVRQRAIIVAASLTVLMGLGAFTCWQWDNLVTSAKNHRARALAGDARNLLESSGPGSAAATMRDAYRLAPDDAEILRTAGITTLAMNSPEAIFFLSKLESTYGATIAERIDLALAYHRFGDNESAELLCRQLLEEAPQDPQVLEFAFSLLLSINDYPGALQAGDQLLRLQPENIAHRIHLASLYLDKGTRTERELALDYLLLAAGEHSDDGARAIDLLLSINPQDHDIRDILIPIVLGNPVANEWQILRTTALYLNLHPGELEDVLEKTFEARRDWPAARLAPVAAWLIGLKEYDFLLAKISRETAIANPGLLPNYLSALAETGRWSMVDEALESSRHLLSDPVYNLYRALVAHYGRNAPEEARIFLTRTLTAIRRTSETSVCFFAADKAEKMGYLDVAVSAFDIASESESPDMCSNAFDGLLRLAQSAGDTGKMNDVLLRYSARFPYRSELSERRLYLDALLGYRIEACLAAAADLVEAEPGCSTPRVIAALCHLRMHDFQSAARILQACDLDRLTSGQKVIAAAVNAASGNAKDFRKLIIGIDPEELLPEERALIPATPLEPFLSKS